MKGKERKQLLLCDGGYERNLVKIRNCVCAMKAHRRILCIRTIILYSSLCIVKMWYYIF